MDTIFEDVLKHSKFELIHQYIFFLKF